MAKRKSLSKGLRFDIFKRDGFVCQYCGNRPPDVILEVDHITPVARGGTNDNMNLITSCEDCNRGKSAKLLNKVQRPDADLAFLETQQEVAELRRYQKAQELRRAALNECVETLQRVWEDYAGLGWAPADHVIRKLLINNDPEMVERAFTAVAPKVAGGYIKNNEWLRYLWGVLKTMKAEAG
jgi:HNH endonuclease